MAMGCRQCLPLSLLQLKGKHCQKPHCCNGVVDTFGPCLSALNFWNVEFEILGLMNLMIEDQKSSSSNSIFQIWNFKNQVQIGRKSELSKIVLILNHHWRNYITVLTIWSIWVSDIKNRLLWAVDENQWDKSCF